MLVTGPESSGSRLIARTISKALDISEFEEYDGRGVNYKSKHKVHHVSLPSGTNCEYLNIKAWVDANKEFDVYLVIATRDINISNNSKIQVHNKKRKQAERENLFAKMIINDVLKSEINYFIWSYETFMFLKQDYLNNLYEFVGIKSDFMPTLKDGNIKYVIKHDLKSKKGLFRKLFNY